MSNYTCSATRAVMSEIEGKYLVESRALLELLLIAYLGRGHVLIEGPPGTAKTLTAKLIARVLSKSFKRIQFTSDLLPADVLGAHLFSPAKQEFQFVKGPIFAEIIVADEINRTPPRTQSALLEAMEERQITSEGAQFELSPDFFVVATQNPEDYEGTFALPEVQLDRFIFKIASSHGDVAAETTLLRKILDGSLPPPFEKIGAVPIDRARIEAEIAAVRVDESILKYIAHVLDATRRHPMLSNGSSVRGGIALARTSRIRALMQERAFVTPDDIKALALYTLGHRVRLSPEAQVANVGVGDVIGEVLKSTEFPG